MRFRRLGLVALAFAAPFLPAAAAPPAAGDAKARAAAETFFQALTRGQAASLRPILPTGGKVHLVLDRMGPEEGFYGAGQVEALFRDFLAAGSVAGFELSRLESDGQSSTLVHSKVQIKDREGRPARIALHLAFQPEDGRWVLREVKETAE